MIRRVHVEKITIGSVALNPADAHHIRDVLRLTEGMPLELFDDAGAVAIGNITHVNSSNVVVRIESVKAGAESAVMLIVAAAVPKGDRADWMVEKLTELGVAKFIPLITERSVVIPAGKNKTERWARIAVESAKQSRRIGVMEIVPITSLDDVINLAVNTALRHTSETAVGDAAQAWFLSTDSDALPIAQAKLYSKHILFIGPEGGWSPAEIDRMKAAGLQAIGLTPTILRVETAAVIAAGMVLCLKAVRLPSNSG